jgi:hypothetical protein
MRKTETKIRKWRLAEKHSLDHVCDLLAKQGLDRPSAAKLSRIEREQVVPPEMIPAFEAITGIPAKEIRPDLARLFLKDPEAAR